MQLQGAAAGDGSETGRSRRAKNDLLGTPRARSPAAMPAEQGRSNERASLDSMGNSNRRPASLARVDYLIVKASWRNGHTACRQDRSRGATVYKPSPLQ
jgi:hypothetical protein